MSTMNFFTKIDNAESIFGHYKLNTSWIARLKTGGNKNAEVKCLHYTFFATRNLLMSLREVRRLRNPVKDIGGFLRK